MASDDGLVCNFKKCRKLLKIIAWTTSCSHVFCEEHGSTELNKCVCPACDTQLPGKYDIVRVDLQPSEEYKSMVLAGQRPETIMEVCSRALSFWTYQSHQEKTYHEFCASKAKEKVQQQESYYDQLINRTQAELSAAKTQADFMRKELQETQHKYSEVSEKLVEKNRQYQKLQGIHESLRRRNVTMASFEDASQHFPPTRPFENQKNKTVPQQPAFLPGNIPAQPIPPVTGMQRTGHHMPTNEFDINLEAAVSAGARLQQQIITKK